MKLQKIGAEDVAGLLPERPTDGHKGTFGHVLILAGSTGYTGAAKLAAASALRSGVGLVSVGVPEFVYPIVSAGMLEAMCHPLPGTQDGGFGQAALEPTLAFAAKVDAVVLGPGISQLDETALFVRQFVEANETPLLLDADGLNAIASHTSILSKSDTPVVVTPHPGEMARLCGLSVSEIQANRADVAARFAEEWGLTVVLKGHETIIASPGGSAAVNTTGNSGMASGGTGDVLSGLIGGLMAQGMNADDAARLGVFAHGRAGDLAAAELSERGMIASDVIEAMLDVWMELESIAP